MVDNFKAQLEVDSGWLLMFGFDKVYSLKIRTSPTSVYPVTTTEKNGFRRSGKMKLVCGHNLEI